MNQIYSIGEARSRMHEMQEQVSNGLLSVMVNKANNDLFFMLNSGMLEAILKELPVGNKVEYDEKQGIYTAYNEIVPHFSGGGKSREEAFSNLLSEAIAFSNEYTENIGTFAPLFNGLQQLLIGLVLLNSGDENKLREILNIV